MPKRNETLTLSVSWKNTQRATSTITIVDQSYPKGYNTRFSSNSSGTNTITSANEGTTAYFIIETDNVDNGTVLKVVTTATGSGTNTATSADFNNYVANQNVTINNNKGYISLNLKADNITEGAEKFTCTLTTSTGTTLSSATLTINDTSQTPAPTYNYGWYSTSAGTTSITSINEGSTAWFVVNTLYVPNNTVLTIRLTGISNSDIADGIIQKDIVINNNVGRVSFAIAADYLAEGVENIVGTLSRSGTTIGNRTLRINDTSIPLVWDIVYPWLYGTSHKTRTDTYHADSRKYINQGFNLQQILSRNGYAYDAATLSRVGTINISIPNDMIIAGRLTTNGDWNVHSLDNFFDGSTGSIYIGPAFNNINVNIVNNGWLFGSGGSRTAGTASNNVNGHPAIVNGSSKTVTVTNNGDIKGGGGAGEGAATSNYIYSGGGAPYGKGYGGGGNATLLTGGDQNNVRGNYGGDVGQRGEGGTGGAPGVLARGGVRIGTVFYA